MSAEQLTIDSRLTLSDGHTIPRFGLGTWRCEPQLVQNIVREAILNHGYRHIDGAWVYKNEDEVGNGVRQAIEQSQGNIKREDLFITTKLWNQHHAPEDVDWAFRESLEKLQLNYVDLYLMHWPYALKKMEDKFSQSPDKKIRYYAEGVTLADTWKAMEKLVDQKLVRSIGLSNGKPEDIEEILQVARIKPVVNQVELHPYLNQKSLREFCAQRNIVVTSYCPLANLKRPDELEDASALYHPVIKEIAQARNKTTAQVILRWHLQHGLTVIPKTVTPARLVENAQVFDFALTEEEMSRIDEVEKTDHRRYVNPEFARPGDKKVYDD